jgi:uncharacterized protein
LPLSPLTVAETSCGPRGGSLLARGPDHEAVRFDAYPDLTIDGSARSLNQTGVAERSAANTTQLTQTESRLRALETPQSIVLRPGADEGMRYFALFYDVVDDFVEHRALFREAHLHLVQEAHRRGEIVLAGALGMPPDRALLIFRGSDPSVAGDFARVDPYVTNGLVTRWDVQPWAVVVGDRPVEGDPVGSSENDE